MNSQLKSYSNQIEEEGFTVVESLYSATELEGIVELINDADVAKPTFRFTKDLFAIRQFLKEIPDVSALIFTPQLKALLERLFGNGYVAVKSIYFDKPGDSNWFVAYHQDLTISVDKKIEMEGFGLWSVKQNQFAVQPPLEILQKNFTVRLHLDDTNEDNGALRVIPGSHLKGIYRPETIDWNKEKEITCSVKRGGVMIMRPLLLHASSRTINNQKRRVIHIEFSNQKLPAVLRWSEAV